jgi:hypothetical protein
VSACTRRRRSSRTSSSARRWRFLSRAFSFSSFRIRLCVWSLTGVSTGAAAGGVGSTSLCRSCPVPRPTGTRTSGAGGAEGAGCMAGAMGTWPCIGAGVGGFIIWVMQRGTEVGGVVPRGTRGGRPRRVGRGELKQSVLGAQPRLMHRTQGSFLGNTSTISAHERPLCLKERRE